MYAEKRLEKKLLIRYPVLFHKSREFRFYRPGIHVLSQENISVKAPVSPVFLGLRIKFPPGFKGNKKVPFQMRI